jgi:hypothetical protein
VIPRSTELSEPKGKKRNVCPISNKKILEKINVKEVAQYRRKLDQNNSFKLF